MIKTLLEVIFGGGRRHWLPKVAKDPEDHMEEGRRLDGRNLVDDWLRDKRKRGIKAAYVWNKQQMDKLEMNMQQVLGLFAYSHMDFELDRDKSGDPSLAEMTVKALSILKRNSNGFFMFVESGRIDHAHHYNNPHRALDETLALEETLLQVLALVNLSETLIVVTADHSHVMTIGGMSTPRGNSILGMDSKVSDIDGLPYSTLLYSNGPGFSVPRLVPSNASATDKNSVHGSGVPRHWATHSGEDVPVYASGPLASVLLTGNKDSTQSTQRLERSYKSMSEAKKLTWRCQKCRKNKPSQVSNKWNNSKVKFDSDPEDTNSESDTSEIGRKSKSDKSVEQLFVQFENTLWKKMSKKLTDIEEFMGFASSKIDDFTKLMKDIQKKLVTMEVEQEKMRQENMEMKSKFKAMEAGMNENAQMFNRNKVEISNIPTTMTNTNEVVAKVLEKVNGEKIDEKSYGTEIRKYENQVNVIVQFESVVQRDKIVKKKRAERTVKLGEVMNNGDETNIYINESLTPYYAKLYAEAKKIKREKNYAFIWIRDGKILMKKTEQSRPMRLMAMEDLGKI
ncbi:hypothetical protein WDU94_007570 [Cyamophila willieti]